MKSGCGKVPREGGERFLKIVAVLGHSRVAYYMETCVRLHFNNKSLMECKCVLLRQQNKKDKDKMSTGQLVGWSNQVVEDLGIVRVADEWAEKRKAAMKRLQAFEQANRERLIVEGGVVYKGLHIWDRTSYRLMVEDAK